VKEKQHMIELVRIPSSRYEKARPEYRATMNKYDYTSMDGRWLVQKYSGCGCDGTRGWTVIYLPDPNVCFVRPTLADAKATIAEWAA
jgi:hypothetical protein